jgi:hypothetical protein
MKDTTDATARIIEKSMKDPVFRQQLLAHPKATIEKETGQAYPFGIKVKVIEEEPDVVVLTIPKLTAAATEELSDQQLETVAGGLGGTFICPGATGCVICLCKVK